MESRLQNLTTENSLLRGEIEKLNKLCQSRPTSECNLTPTDVSTKASYADAIAKNSQQTVIVKPKDKEQPINKTKSDILSKINPVESSLNIGKVKNLKEGSVLLGCDDVSKFKQLSETNKLYNDYDIKVVKTLRPRIRIAGISDSVDENNILKYLVKQNEIIFDKDSEYKLIKLSKIKNNEDRFQVLVEVDVSTYKRALSLGHCLIGLDGCSIYSGIGVSRCFQCNCFNHSSSKCNKELSCPKCSDKHKIQDCKAENLCCGNCFNLKRDGKSQDIDTNHAAWDYNSCHAYNLAVNKIKQDVFGLPI
ncbi:hypothetical protein Zmor_003801 [Zophobas morio]|uniref:Uncharacterized protein n=1 Tax=Zophobas morio TaxID=2755281 RepID=A0AA38M1M8_9CUCU|nr:hypothetical protein Zmor_003801 [Zophobas morio]